MKLQADVRVESDWYADSEHRSSNDHRNKAPILNYAYAAPEYGITGM